MFVVLRLYVHAQRLRLRQMHCYHQEKQLTPLYTVVVLGVWWLAMPSRVVWDVSLQTVARNTYEQNAFARAQSHQHFDNA